MIPDDHGLLLFRFGEKRWMEKLVHGEMSFSCAGAFINQATTEENNIQGDKYEGVFARLFKDDKTILRMRALLDRDLEEIEDGHYILLRRRSSRLKPIFCFYGYTAGDLLSDGKIKHEGVANIKHYFDPKMFSGFADNIEARNVINDSHRFTLLFFQPKPFVDKVQKTMLLHGLGFKMKKINYELFESKTFLVEPTTKYDELFYKFPQNKYQHETRICLTDINLSNIFERYNVNIGSFSKDDYSIHHEKLYVESNVNIGYKI